MAYLDYAGLTRFKNKSLEDFASKFSNPNLLINSNFAINQRGESSYTTGGKYTVDRWYLLTNGATVTPTNDGITLTALAASNSFMGQRIENGFEILKGKTITFTICLIDGTKKTQTGTVPTTTPSSTTAIGTAISSGNFSATGCYLNSAGLLFVQIGARQNTSLNIAWCKLEIGDAATTYSPPTIAEELTKCQRYFQNIKTQFVRSAFTNAAQFIIYLPTTMRTIPTISFGSGSGVQAVSGGSIDTTYTLSIRTPHKDNCINVRATKDGATYADCVLNLQGTTTLDAEIY